GRYPALPVRTSFRLLAGAYSQRTLQCRAAAPGQDLQARRCVLQNAPGAWGSLGVARCPPGAARRQTPRPLAALGAELRTRAGAQQSHRRTRQPPRPYRLGDLEVPALLRWQLGRLTQALPPRTLRSRNVYHDQWIGRRR